MITWTFGKRIAAGFVVAVVLIFAVSTAAYETVTSAVENAGWVAHSHEVIAEITALRAAHGELQSGSRGFVITGDAAMAEGLGEGFKKAEVSFQRLSELTRDNPEQASRLSLLKAETEQQMEYRRRLVETRKTAGFDRAAALVAAAEGRKVLARLESLAEDMEAAERRLLATRAFEAASSAASTKATALVGSVLAGLVMLAVGVAITRSLTYEIGVANQNLQSSSTELHAAANQQVGGARDQASALVEVATTMKELLTTSRQISESAERVTRIADETSVSAKAGGKSVEKGQAEIEHIQRQVDLMTAQVIDLGKKSQQIGEILAIINELSEQTNILAINATIEAAGAGESGKRFAAVADEIRKLADRVGSSTKDISALIDLVRSSATSAVMAAESGSKAVESGARQFGELVATFHEIRQAVVSSTDTAREIELSTKQQASAVEQVNIAIGNITRSAKESEVSSTQTLQTAAQLSVVSKNLARIILPSAA